jgi:hypothetical protein
MEKMNDRARAADVSGRENDGDGEKNCDFGEKIAPRLGAEIFAADVDERRPWTAGRTAVIAIKRGSLKIAIYDRKSESGSPAAKIPASPVIVPFGVRFHRLLTFLL